MTLCPGRYYRTPAKPTLSGDASPKGAGVMSYRQGVLAAGVESRFLLGPGGLRLPLCPDAVVQGGGTLLARLESSGILTLDAVRQVRSGVMVSRLN